MAVMFAGAVILALVLVGAPVQAVEPLVLYDDFNATRINPNKWFGSELRGAEVTRATAAAPLPAKRRLRLLDRAHGGRDSDTGTRNRHLALNFADPAAVTAIEATVLVKNFKAARCAANPAATSVQARLTGDFFNTATPTAGSAVNDVLAGIRIIRRSSSPDPPEVLRVSYFVFHCGDVGCLSGTVLDAADLGPISKGQAARLRIQWDPDNHQFIFQRDAGPAVVSAYAVSDAALPGRLNKRLTVESFVANCTAGAAPEAFMEAFFDDVFVNSSAAAAALGADDEEEPAQ